MFAVIEIETIPAQSLFARVSERLRGQDHLSVYEDDSLGTRVLRVQITFSLRMRENKKRKLVLRALGQIAQSGIKGVVLPDDFAYTEELEAFGLAAPDAFALYRRIAGRMGAYAAKKCRLDPAALTCAIMAESPTPLVVQAVKEAGVFARYLAFCCAQDVSTLCRALRRDCGAAVLENPSEGLLSRAGLFFVFDPPAGGTLARTGKGAVFLLFGRFAAVCPESGCVVANGARLRPPARLLPVLPDCGLPGLLMALVASGAVKADELDIEALTFDRQPVL